MAVVVLSSVSPTAETTSSHHTNKNETEGELDILGADVPDCQQLKIRGRWHAKTYGIRQATMPREKGGLRTEHAGRTWIELLQHENQIL